MKICFPVAKNKGLDSRVFNHFGSAPMFLLVDAEQRSVAEEVNRDVNHQHGACRPLRALGGQEVEAIVVGGIGAGALSGLNQAGFKVYQAETGTIAENLDRFLEQGLTELTPAQTCGGHHRHHCGSHHGEADIEAGCGF